MEARTGVASLRCFYFVEEYFVRKKRPGNFVASIFTLLTVTAFNLRWMVHARTLWILFEIWSRIRNTKYPIVHIE